MSTLKEIAISAVLASTLCLLAHEAVDAQQGGTPLEHSIALFNQGEFEQAMDSLQQLLATSGLSKKERSTVRKYIAVGHIQLGTGEKAVAVFKDLVNDNPDFNMDDLTLEGEEKPDPEAVRYFGQAVLEVHREELQARAAQLSLTSRKVAFLHSAMLPGWGQRYQGYRGRGYMMLGMTSASLVYAVLARRWYKDAQDIYKKAPREADFPKLYDDYTSKTDRANFALGMVGAVWLFNVLDAAIQGPALPRGPQRLSLNWQASDHGLQVAFTKRF